MSGDTAAEKDSAGPYIVWKHYGSEGWAPESYATEAEMVSSIMGGNTYGNRFVVTRRLVLTVEDEV